jgi:hypothetical protein
MQRVSRRLCFGWILGLGIGLVLSASSVAVEPAAPPDPAPAVGAAPPAAITVIGVVEVRRDETGQERLVQIVGEEERTLIVDEVGAGRALAQHAGERVSATGVVSHRKDGREVLRVSSFRPLGG